MQSKKQHMIVIKSYNPYSTRFPNYKVVTRETLHLIKYLRERNYKIIVDTEDGRKLNYLAEKGVREFLADTIIAYLKDMSLSVALNVFSSWLYDEMKKWKQKFGEGKPLKEASIILEIEENGRKVRYTHTGKQLSDEAYFHVINRLVTRQRDYGNLYNLAPPNTRFLYPITLEHTPQIVGWAEDIRVDGKGLFLGGVKITDEETLRRIEIGELIGFSIGGIVTNSICGICKQEFTDCNHISGNKYEGSGCVVEITGIRLADFSVVSDPVNYETLIQIDPRYLK